MISKTSGKYKVIKTIGSSSDPDVINNLVSQGHSWINLKTGSQELDFTDYNRQVFGILDNITELNSVGVGLILGKIFDEIGFNKISDEMFKHLVLARLANPTSKLKTTDYLYKYHSIDVDVQVIYRYLDKLHKKQMKVVQKISYEHTLKILDNTISIVFYDVTTMYFEIEQEDDLRKIGFSKDGKSHNPQVVLGLLVAKNGYPLAYDIFEGNKFEGHTMIPIITAFKEKYKIDHFLVVADAGLLSKENINELEQKGFKYILGARLKNESAQSKEKILKLDLKNGQTAIITDELKERRTIISYSNSRAKKDAFNRTRGVDKLKKQIKTGKLTKQHINNRGYNKFLEIKNTIEVEISNEKIKEDEKWDGLKGYVTNSTLDVDTIIENYGYLWQIEKAFRIAKTDLRVRPIYHRVQKRIEAHICIVFAAYKVYKELERQLKILESPLSPEKVIEIAKTINSITLIHPTTREVITKVLLLKNEQKDLMKLFNL